MIFKIIGGTIAIYGFLVTFLEQIHKRFVKVTTNNFLLSQYPTLAFALIQSWEWNLHLLSGIDFLVGGAFVAWFTNDIMAIVGLPIIGCSMSFLQQVGISLFKCGLFIYFRSSYIAYHVYEIYDFTSTLLSMFMKFKIL